MKSKPLYTSYTFGNFLRTVAFKVICIAAIIYLVFHFQENQIVIGICIILVLLLLASGNDHVVIYADHFEIKSDSLLKMSARNTWHSYTEVEMVSGQPQPASSEVIAYILLKPFIKVDGSDTRKLFVKLKSGEERTYHLNIPSYELSKVVSLINERLVK